MWNREWVLSEEDIQLQLLSWLKYQKRVTTQATRLCTNDVLLTGEGEIRRLDRYGLSLPISSTAVYSWMIKLGCKFEENQ